MAGEKVALDLAQRVKTDTDDDEQACAAEELSYLRVDW